MSIRVPIARGPLVKRHRAAGAKVERVDGWEIAVRYPQEPVPGANTLVDLTSGATFEINGPQTGANLQTLCGTDVPLRTIHVADSRHVYRLTPTRAIVRGALQVPANSIDVTGGWSCLALSGPDREKILNKITAVDLREQTLPLLGCCQGPIFGVNVLFGRFADHFTLQVCPDSAEFFWDVVLDAGREFSLQPAGTAQFSNKA